MAMNESTSPELQVSQSLLEKLEPLIRTVEHQLMELGQGQILLQNHVSQMSSELALSQTELDKVQDTFAKLPHYIAKITAMKNMIASVQIQSRKVKRRAELVVIGREKQANKQQAARAKEKAYDQAIAAVKVSPTTASPTDSLPEPTKDTETSSSDRPSTPSIQSIGKSIVAGVANSLQPPKGIRSPVNLPFPLPAKPAFPVVSTRSPNGSPPPGLSQRLSPLLSRRSTGRENSASPTGGPASDEVSIRSGSTEPPESDDVPEDRVDRFPEISAMDNVAATVGSEVEVVRVVRRKKKTSSRSNASSTSTLNYVPKK
ncbi:MAG: hypothetical protein BYD32DRAFT_429884 [Podila humilis]|nr:MAG: hypothetical protein BYD32DRAFT_429884 [Podila humilis]